MRERRPQTGGSRVSLTFGGLRLTRWLRLAITLPASVALELGQVCVTASLCLFKCVFSKAINRAGYTALALCLRSLLSLLFLCLSR